ncbi:MAG: CsbD family protein [Planctomycetaceae bacterium]
MNWDQIQGNWKQLSGRAKEKWGKLTDNDITESAGRREQLAGLLQERYGYAREEADRVINEFAAELKDKIHS